MNKALPISRLIHVSVILTPQAAQAQDLSTLLILGNSDIIDVVERLRTYDTIDAVSDDFGTLAPEYLAAALWFEQAPQPYQLMIGRWAQSATSAILRGGVRSTAQQLLSAWTSIVDGAMRISINGVLRSITAADFSAATNMNGVAAVVQAKLAAQVGGTTCTWDSVNQRFQIEVAGSTGTGSTIGFATYPPAAQGYFLFTANPANLDTITLNGTAVTFVAAGAVGNQVNIGADLAATLANLMTFLTTSVNAQLVKFTYSLAGAQVNLQAVATGAAGNALTTSEASTSITVSGATLTGGTGTDIATLLGLLTSSSGAYLADGIAAETAVAAAALFDSYYGQTWYGLTMPTISSNDDHLAVAAYIEAGNNKHVYGVSTQEAGAISAVSTTDIAYLLKALRYKRSIVQYSSSNAYSVCSLLGRALTVNYNGNATVIDLMYKQEPGIIAEALTATQTNALTAKNCNVFVAYNNNTAIVQPGNSSSGDPIDIITGTDWLAVTIMTAEYNELYTSPTRIPQTDPGTNILVTAAKAVCSQAVTNGLLAPGVWNSAGFGTLKKGDLIASGFYIYAPSVGLQLQADREARKSVPIQIAVKLAGAVRTIDLSITVNR